MGHRAHYLIKDEKSYKLFYSHWGANVVDRDLFWGPDAAFDYISAQRPSEEVDERLLV